MKNSLFKTLLVAVMAVMSMGAGAVDWSGIEWVGNGAGGDYTNKYKFYTEGGPSMVNIQQPGFASAAGFYITFPDAAFNALVDGSNALTFDQQGAGVVLHLTNFTKQETTVSVKNNDEVRWTFYIYYEDGTIGGGGVDPETPTITYRTVYFYNASSWSTVKAHSWETDGASTTWPGTAMTDEGNGWYSIELADTYANIIFNDGTDANKTADLTIPAKNPFYANGWVREIRGLGNWNNGKEWTLTNSTLCYTATYNAFTQTSFKFHSNGGDSWYGNGGTITKTSDFSIWWDMTADHDIVLRTGKYAGEYTFQYNPIDQRFKVVFPEVENATLTKNGHVVTLNPEYYGKGDYKLTITSTENLAGLGGAFWNVNGASTDMRTSLTVVDAHTLVCEVTSTSAPTINTPLYVMMPGEIAFEIPNALDWVNMGPVATASSGDASQAIDGKNNTRWESSFSDDQWFMVDYRAPKQFNNIQILWEGAYGKTFNILGSNDGSAWTNITSVEDQSLSGFPYTQTIELASVAEYQYVKFEGIARGTGYGYSFYEFDVFYREVDVLTTMNVSNLNRFATIGDELTLTVTTLNQYGEPMDVTVTYDVTPAAAGHVADGKYFVDQAGDATITVTAGSKVATAKVCGVVSENLALNKAANAGVNPAAAGASNNGNGGDRWGSNGGTHPDDDWWYVDLGATCNISMLAIKWETACPDNYDIKVSDDGENWTLAKNYTDYPVNGNGSNDFHIYTDLGTATGRYIGVWANTGYAGLAYGISFFEFNVYGTQTAANISISDAKYATYYNADKAYTMPAGLEGITVEGQVGTTLTLETRYAAGSVVPAGEPLILHGEAGNYTLNYTTTSDAVVAANLLKGTSTADEMTTGGDKYYRLSVHEGAVGFYYGAAEGAAFKPGANKAYLALSASDAPAQFLFEDSEDIATAIEAIEANGEAVKFIENGQIMIRKNGVVYTVLGQVVR